LSSNAPDFETDGIVVVDADDDFLQQSKQVFEGRVATAPSLEGLDELVIAGDVDVILLGPSFADEDGIASAANLLDVDPDLVMVLVASPDVNNTVLRAAIRSGLSDVIEAPLTFAAVTETLRQAERSMRRRSEAPTEAPVPHVEGRIVTVMAAKGGSGKTVVASNVAAVLVNWIEPSRVCIVDADLQFGDIALVMQIDPKHTVVNAAKEGDSLDSAFLDTVLATHESGMRVLAAPLEPAFADEVSTAQLVNILAMLKKDFEYVVVDTAPALDDRLLAILDVSDTVLFVVDMDLPSVKNAKLALETLRILNYPANKIKLVLNRSNSKARLDVDEIERSLRLPISADIPSDGLVPASVNEGIPIVESHPKSKPAKAFEEVAKLVLSSDDAAKRRSRRRRFGI
jgi:pilus assembly protein CpaE